MSICLSQEQVERYTSGECSIDEQQLVEVHLTECETCRKKIESFRLNISTPNKSDKANADFSANGVSTTKQAINHA